MDSDIQVLRNRHFAVMDCLMAHPDWTQKEVAEALGYSESWLSQMVNSSLFQTAFKADRKRYEDDLRASILAGTKDAIKVSREIMNDANQPAVIRRQSAKDILDQGHAAAIQKSASLSLSAEVPAELLPRLDAIMKELDVPFAPKKLMVRPEEKVSEDGAWH
jgi:transcriptional regulator with XRE-family HTH domain